MDQPALLAALEAAALTAAELAEGPAAWLAYPDPFDSWDHPADDLAADNQHHHHARPD